MPTFDDPRANANELAEAARGLAHSTGDIAVAEAVYAVLGSLDYALGSLRQPLVHLSAWHSRNLDRSASLVAGAGQLRQNSTTRWRRAWDQPMTPPCATPAFCPSRWGLWMPCLSP